MKKTEMMKRYETETGKQSAILKFITGGQALEQKSYPKLGPYDYNMDYIAWLEAKAAAYDRLMSGTGKMSMQEWANFLATPVTLDRDGKVKAHYSSPVRYSEEEGWWYNPYNRRFEIPRHLVDTHGCWPRLSITYPDGWEEACDGQE